MRTAKQKRDKRKRAEEGSEEGEDYVAEELEERGAKKVRLLRSGREVVGAGMWRADVGREGLVFVCVFGEGGGVVYHSFFSDSH